MGPDGGIDVLASDAIAQVKAHMQPIGRPDVQNLYGVATAQGKTPLFFSLSGYTAAAAAWAEEVGVGLFTFDLQGSPQPVNGRARAAVQAAAGSGRSHEPDEEPEPGPIPQRCPTCGEVLLHIAATNHRGVSCDECGWAMALPQPPPAEGPLGEV